MRLSDLILISDAIEKIHNLTETHFPDIVDALTGIAWDENDAGQIKSYNEADEVVCRDCEGQGVITHNPNLNPDSFQGISTDRCTRCDGTGIASKENIR